MESRRFRREKEKAGNKDEERESSRLQAYHYRHDMYTVFSSVTALLLNDACNRCD